MSSLSFSHTVTERFLRYVTIDTQSDPDSPHSPSTEKQKDLGRVLAAELKAMLAVAQREKGGLLTTSERLRAIQRGSSDVIKPSLFGTLIIAVVYLPVLTLTGVEGKMFTPMALTVLMALGAAVMRSFTASVIVAVLSLGTPALVQAQGASSQPGTEQPSTQSSTVIRSIQVVDVKELQPAVRAKVDELVAHTSDQDIQSLRQSIDATPQAASVLKAKGLSSSQVIAINIADGVLTMFTKTA